MTSESFVAQKARGLYRWERGEGWSKEDELTNFEEGQAVTIDPFKNARQKDSKWLWPVFCTFVQYKTENIAEVKIPSCDGENRTWFTGEAGNYLIHEGYLTPQ